MIHPNGLIYRRLRVSLAAGGAVLLVGLGLRFGTLATWPPTIDTVVGGIGLVILGTLFGWLTAVLIRLLTRVVAVLTAGAIVGVAVAGVFGTVGLLPMGLFWGAVIGFAFATPIATFWFAHDLLAATGVIHDPSLFYSNELTEDELSGEYDGELPGEGVTFGSVMRFA